MSFEVVRAHLDAAEIKYALIGGVALAARGAGRSTLDIDVLTTDAVVLKDDFWASLRGTDIQIDVRKGDWDDPLAGVVRIDAGEAIDVVVGKYKWERAVIERAERMVVRGMSLRVPSVSDLILLKLSAGGPRDTMDASNLMNAGDRAVIIEELTAVAPTLPETLQSRVSAFLQNSSPIGP